MLSLSGAFLLSSAVGLEAGQTQGTVSATSDSDSRIHQRFTVRWDPDRDQHVEISARFERENVEGNMRIRVPENGAVVDAGEFERSGDRQFSTSAESDFVYSVPVRPDEFHRAIFGDEGWALVAPHQVINLIGFTPGTQPVIDFVDIHDKESQDGLVGGWHVYLGKYESFIKEADKETIQLIVPDAASLDESPTDFVEELAFASDRLSIGGTAETVYKFVVPDDSSAGSSNGSNNSAWTTHRIPLTWDHNGLSVWVHEYVHTRQVYGSALRYIETSETRWLFEGLADHYGALIPYESGTATFDELRRSYERGYRDRHEDAVLVDEDSWREERGDYTLGALVLGKIDLEIRRETDADRSLDEVLQQINEIPFDDEFTHEQLLDIIRDVASNDVSALADTYITGTERPDFWSEETHRQYFPAPAITDDDEASSGEEDEQSSEEEESDSEEDGGTSEDEEDEGTSEDEEDEGTSEDEEDEGTSDEDEESSNEGDETTSANGIDDEVPGLGVVATLTGLGSVLGYHLLSSDEVNKE